MDKFYEISGKVAIIVFRILGIVMLTLGTALLSVEVFNVMKGLIK